MSTADCCYGKLVTTVRGWHGNNYVPEMTGYKNCESLCGAYDVAVMVIFVDMYAA